MSFIVKREAENSPVSMGRPYLEKFADVKWETNEKHLKAWKEGRTGVPIVDAVSSRVPYRWHCLRSC